MAAGGKGQAPIIIKRVKKVAAAAHGGAWKVAYADFVTAMMALFLMLWLLNAVTEIQKQGIADYFGPSITQPVASVGSGGLLGGLAIGKPGALPHPSAAPSVSIPIPAERTPDAPEDDQRSGQSGHDDAESDPGNDSDSTQPAAKPEKSESSEKPDLKTTRSTGAQKSEKDRTGGDQDADKPFNNTSDKEGAGHKPEKPQAGNADKANDKFAAGKTDKAPNDKPIDEAAAEKLMAQREEEAFANAELKLKAAIKESPELTKIAGNIIIDRTADGLRIQLVDQYSSTMFPLGSSDMVGPARKLMAQVAQIIAKMPNKVAITGHTDGTPYIRRGNYSNWELSSDRANASRRELIASGVKADQIAQVVGRADREPMLADQPFNPINRRISIVLLSKTKAENAAPAPP